MKRMLMVASVPSMIGQFNMGNINILLSLGYHVDVACDWNDRSVWNDDKVEDLKNKLKQINVNIYQVDFSRNIIKINRHIKSCIQLINLIKKKKYNFIHCHSPIGGAISRLVCKKTNTKCIYTAHGFHFYKGAPIQNWILFYPIEKWLSKYTDILITINKEDYNRAKNSFKMKQLEYVAGIGIDLNKLKLKEFNRENYRKELGFTKENFIILSVGELNKNKNHEVVIRAIAELDNNIHYLIAGQGILEDYLINLSKELKVDERVHLLGFRNDIAELNYSADLFILPSLREGLNVSLMEAMACHLPCIASNIRGNNDLIKDTIGGYLVNTNDIVQLRQCINFITSNNENKKIFGKYNKTKVLDFSKEKVVEEIINIYSKV